MADSERIAEIVRSLPSVSKVFIPSEDEMDRVFSAEGAVRTGSGMRMRNDSLAESMKRPEHLIVVHGENLEHRIPHHSITWETDTGRTVAFDVPDDLRQEVEGRDDLIWISEDFAMVSSADIEDVVCVLHPAPIGFIGEKDGVRDPIIMYPATPVDQLIRRMYSVDPSPKYATAVLSYYWSRGHPCLAPM